MTAGIIQFGEEGDEEEEGGEKKKTVVPQRAKENYKIDLTTGKLREKAPDLTSQCK